MNYFVTAIGTDSGKTVASAIITEALQADYWKPIQAGTPRDSDQIRVLLSNNNSKVLEEQYVLKTPASPHYAAEVDLVQLKISDFKIPNHSADDLVIEGAGGILVPINQTEFVIDLAAHFDTAIILVCDLYLGSINHSLLSIKEIQRRRLTIKGIIFNGQPNAASEAIILRYAAVPQLLHIMPEEEINPAVIRKYAEALKGNL